MSTYTKAKEFIENTTDKTTLYNGIREILSEDMIHYPEDCEIKTLQRLADAKYEELSAKKHCDNVLPIHASQPGVKRKGR